MTSWYQVGGNRGTSQQRIISHKYIGQTQIIVLLSQISLTGDLIAYHLNWENNTLLNKRPLTFSPTQRTAIKT